MTLEKHIAGLSGYTVNSWDNPAFLSLLNRDQGLTTPEPDMAAYAGRAVHFKDGVVEQDSGQ